MSRSEGVYVNTLNVQADPGRAGRRMVKVSAPAGFPLLAAWKLGVDSDWADVPGVRVSAQLRVLPSGMPDVMEEELQGEALDQFLYRAPARPLQGSMTTLPAPYEIEPGEALYLFVKVTNDTQGDPVRGPESITARANVFAYFVPEGVQ